MKVLSLILVVIVSLSITGCLKTFSTGIENPKIPLGSLPVLEISEDAEGPWQTTGKTLLFRLYENGVAEFEYVDEQKIVSNKPNRAEEINSVRRIKMNEADLKEFIDLLNSKDFQEIKVDYRRQCCCVDATLSYEIRFQSFNEPKRINLAGYCDSNELVISGKQSNSGAPALNYRRNFPVVISELIELVTKTRAKFRSSNQSL